jgi:hypothetical protein
LSQSYTPSSRRRSAFVSSSLDPIPEESKKV